MARRERKSKTKRTIDFSQAVKYFEEDEDVVLEVKSATWEDGQEYPYIALVFKGEDDYEEAELYHNASMSPKALTRTRSLLEALGYEVQEGDTDVDTDELIGLRCMGHTFLDTYEGNDGKKKETVKCDDFWPIDGKGDGKSKKDDKDAGAKKGGKGKKDEPKLDRDDIEKMDRDELIELINEHDLDDIDLKDRKLKKDDDALREAVIAALEEKDLLEEAEPAGKGGRSKGGSKKSKDSPTWKESDIAEMNEKELKKVAKEAELDDIDFDELPTLRKMKNAVIDALEEKDMIEKDD